MVEEAIIGKKILVELVRKADVSTLKRALKVNKQATIDFILSHNLHINVNRVAFQSEEGGQTVKPLGEPLTVKDYLLLAELEPIWHCLRGVDVYELGASNIIYDSRFIRQLVINSIMETSERNGQVHARSRSKMGYVWQTFNHVMNRCRIDHTNDTRGELPLPDGIREIFSQVNPEGVYAANSRNPLTHITKVKDNFNMYRATKSNGGRQGLYEDMYEFLLNLEKVQEQAKREYFRGKRETALLTQQKALTR